MNLTIDDVGKFGIEDYLNTSFTCECGKNHSVGLERVIVESGALQKLPEILEHFKYESIFMIADDNTYKAVGSKVEQILLDTGLKVDKLVYQRDRGLVPDERAVGEFLTSFNKDSDAIVTVGSGVLSDISKFMSYMLNLPAIMVPTVPSMDGYASVGSAFIIKGRKISLKSTPPKAIIADIDVLKEAPMKMIIAGLGDMLGKYSSLRDWKLAKIINKEYYCDVVRKMAELSLNRCVENIDGFITRDEKSIGALIEGLILSGIAMSFVGNSRPASGAEHHISHFWELHSLMKGEKPNAHGVQVAIATLLTSSLAHELANMEIDFDKILENVDKIDQNQWKSDIQRVYKDIAPEIIRLNTQPLEEAIEDRRERVSIIRDNWDEIVKIIKATPSASEIESLLKKTGEDTPTKPEDIGFATDLVKDTILYAKEVRKRYSILQLLWDIGLLEELEILKQTKSSLCR